ncbi:MAG: hypothetical protein NTY04_03790 [Candidatus Staskawiczbacteria bacterium]|nr:hypothetical protein [Candidatus Staskawiczbacteria bacterium]
MDTTSLVEIVIVIVAIYLFVKFVVTPIVKAIVGIIIFLVLIYLLQRFLGFDVDKVLAPFGVSLNISNWGSSFSWITGPLTSIVDQAKGLISFITGNFPKAVNK